MMKTITKTALFLILNALIIQSLYCGEFRFDYDYCVFKYDNQKLFLEFYYSFNQQQLTFIKSDNGFEADGELNLEVFDKDESKVVIQKRYKVPVNVRDTAGYNKSANLTGQVNFLLLTAVIIYLKLKQLILIIRSIALYLKTILI